MSDGEGSARRVTCIALPDGILAKVNPAGMTRERAWEIALAVLAVHGRFPTQQKLEDRRCR